MADLVSSVVEAYEKKNLERVDVLILNAIKLKLKCFKPDQATCISFAYLAKTRPEIFSQSTTIKDTFKSFLRRDNGPTNNIVLPILAANVLIASCDSTEVRSIILNKVNQWLSNNQKVTDIVQHLIATICMNCQSDPQTVDKLTEMRHHWLHYMRDNYDTYGSLPVDLCASVRKLLHKETDGEKLMSYLSFLMRYDKEIYGLSQEVGEFINQRPMTLENLLGQEKIGIQLNKMLLEIFTQLFENLKLRPKIKLEAPSLDVKPSLDRRTLEAILLLLSMTSERQNCKEDYDELIQAFLTPEDFGMTKILDLADNLRSRLALSNDQNLIDLSLQGASTSQLVKLLLQCGTTIESVKKILKKIDSIQELEAIRAELNEDLYFGAVIDYYIEQGSSEARNFLKRIDQITYET